MLSPLSLRLAGVRIYFWYGISSGATSMHAPRAPRRARGPCNDASAQKIRVQLLIWSIHVKAEVEAAVEPQSRRAAG
eukprot:SAG22_NODE_18817_length_281_cov_0.642857_1_plen_76_part_10